MLVEAQSDQPTTLLQQVEFVVTRLTEFGVKINPSSRIGRMLSILRRPESIQHDDPDYPLAIESIRDMHQLRQIVEVLDAHREIPEFRKAVTILKKDATFPEEGDQSPGRNYQFQLYLAALCTNAGLSPHHEEPDVQFVFEGTTFGIAAKRLRTFSQLEAHLKDGADQIRRAGVEGMIALDLTIAWNPTNRRIVSQIESQFYEQLSLAKTRRFAADYGDQIKSWVAGRGVLAIWTFESTLRLVPDRTWSHELWGFWYPTTEDEEQKKLLTRLQRGFLSGVPSLIDLTVDE